MLRFILAFNFAGERLAALRLAGLVAKAQVRLVEPGNFAQKLGYLAGLPGYARWEAEPGVELPPLPQAEFIYLVGFDRQGLDRLLAAIKRGRLGRVDLKAMATPTNAHWTAIRLAQELQDEHSYMGKVNKKLMTLHQAAEGKGKAGP